MRAPAGAGVPTGMSPRTLLLAALAAAVPGCNDPGVFGAGPRAAFDLTLAPDDGATVRVRGDSAAWRNDGSPWHRQFELVLLAPEAPPGLPTGKFRLAVLSPDKTIAAGSVPVEGEYAITPGQDGLATYVQVEVGSAWRATAIDGVLTIADASPDLVRGALDVRLAVLEDHEPRPEVHLRGSFTARAWEE